MIVVLDTNIVVSGIFFHGPPAAILDAWWAGRSEPRVALPRDPADAKFLDCAGRAGARYLISGDHDLQSFKGPSSFAIVSPRQFLQRL